MRTRGRFAGVRCGEFARGRQAETAIASSADANRETAASESALDRTTVRGEREHGAAVATQNWFNGITPRR